MIFAFSFLVSRVRQFSIVMRPAHLWFPFCFQLSFPRKNISHSGHRGKAVLCLKWKIIDAYGQYQDSGASKAQEASRRCAIQILQMIGILKDTADFGPRKGVLWKSEVWGTAERFKCARDHDAIRRLADRGGPRLVRQEQMQDIPFTQRWVSQDRQANETDFTLQNFLCQLLCAWSLDFNF